MMNTLQNSRVRPRYDEGFTLIEIVVALAILGTGMVILLETHFASMQLLVDAQEQGFFDSFLEAAVGAAETEVLFGEESGDGDFGERYPEYNYTFEAIQLDKDNVPGLFEVTVTVHGPFEDRVLVFYTFDANQTEIDGTG